MVPNTLAEQCGLRTFRLVIETVHSHLTSPPWALAICMSAPSRAWSSKSTRPYSRLLV